MKEITLPSGATLKISVSPFAIAKNLYQAVLEEAKGLSLDPNAEVDVNLFKDLFCAGFSSKRIEACLIECMKRATYNGAKVDDSTFEPETAREDYLMVCWEVAMVNLLPFTKNLSLRYSQMLQSLTESQK